MKIKIPEILLVLYIFLPVKSALVAQVLLCQVRSIQLSKRAERKLAQSLEDAPDQGLGDILRALWFSSGNTTAYAYFKLLAANFNPADSVDVESMAVAEGVTP